MNAEPIPRSASWVHSIMADTTPAVRPTLSAGKSRAATSQNRNPSAIDAARPVLRHHRGEPPAVRPPLAAREVPARFEAVLHHRALGDADLLTGLLEPPAQLDVLTRREAGVESVAEELLALEDGGDQAEP